ncbi:MAG: Potassium channel [Thelocarpon superellum]|nr:MAG: Potassium channel [Thelocarpon superellum]
MNDPGIDGAIGEEAKDVEKRQISQREREEELAASDQRDPSRWWFASTAAPLIAGTFGPMASSFNICALSTNWRIHIPPGLAEPQSVPIQDPQWLLALNGVSVAVAILANFALLLNMARRVPFSVAQPITIIGWYFSSVLLIGMVAASPAKLALDDPDHVFSQAFYYAIISAVIYFIIATMMVATVWGAFRGHYSRDFKLSTSQRTLMLQTISYLIYLQAGAAVFAHIEGWTYLDGVYYADVTLLTVGFGDFVPVAHLSRSLLFPFAIGGILMLGLVIGSIRSLVLERGKKKMGAREMEKLRAHVVKKLETNGGPVKLTPIRARTLDQKDTSELDRRRQEFHLMRQIQNDAAKKGRWYSLVISATVWLGLWTIGAVVFWQGEYAQDWSYFEALYFAYVSLLTIGYGDLRIMNESSKAFFVFWSLLAVPTMTILISNMGDTVVRLLRDGALWVGELTVLPAETGVRQRLKQTAAKITPGDFGFSEAEPMAGATSSGEAEDPGPKKQKDLEAVSGAAKEYEGAEEDAAADAAERGDIRGMDRHHRHYLLMREMRRVMSHMKETPPRKYSYEEWAHFLKFMGHDEAVAANHAAARTDCPETESNADAATSTDEEHSETRWSWIGAKSPLMDTKDEAEWVLENLAAALEQELREERDKRRREREQEKGAKGDSGSEQHRP